MRDDEDAFRQRGTRILQVAEEFFLERGYAATKLQDVAVACGISKKTVYQHFQSKEQVFSAVISQDHGLHVDGDVAVLNSKEFEAFYASMLADALSPGRVALARLIFREAAIAPELPAQFLKLNIQRGQSAIQRNLETIFEAAGVLHSKAVAKSTAVLIGATIGDLILRAVAGEDVSPHCVEARRSVSKLLNDLLEQAETR